MAAPSAREHKPIYICEMMECLGIDPGGRVVPRLSLSYLTAFHRCQSGPSKPVTFGPRFCPNADIFFELQVDYPQRHKGSWRTT